VYQSEYGYVGILLPAQCRLLKADYRLLPLSPFGILIGPIMFAVTSGYSASEKILLMRERCLLAEWETGAADNLLNTDCLLTCEL